MAKAGHPNQQRITRTSQSEETGRTVVLPKPIYQKMKKIADAQKVPVANVIIELCEQKLID